MTPTFMLSPRVLLVGVLAVAACNFDVANPNAPEPLGENPSREDVAGASVGLLAGTRVDLADWVLDAAILGREAYRFDGSDPRFTTELLQGPLDPGGNAFGGDHWNEPYANIRGAKTLLAVVGTSSELSAEEQSAVSGFARTIQALEFLNVVNGHTQDSIPIDVVGDVTAAPAPFRSHADAMTEIVSLLDQGRADLQAGGTAFPFTLPSGFTGFNTPETFIRFNRALRARVAVYLNDFAGALTALSESFMDRAAPLSLGVYVNHGTGPGDFANPLAQDPQVGENFVHPSMETDAQFQLDGVTLDQRFLDKTVPRPLRSVGSDAGQLSSDLGWIRYTTPSTPIPIIRNEELILLHAEASIGIPDLVTATDDINFIRTTSGRLAAIPLLATPEAALDELLYNKRYSLMYEGHRWIDVRHYGRLGTLPIDRPANTPPDVIFSTLPIPTAEVLSRQ